MSGGWRQEAGFSLLEMMVAGAVMLAVLGATLSLTYQSQANSSDRAGDMATRQVARVALSRFAVEAALVGYGADGLAPIELAEPDRLRFVADVDDGSAEAPCTDETPVSSRPERITYELRDDGTLRRGVQCRNANNTAWVGTPAWIPVAEGIDSSAPLFRYVDGGGNELGNGTGPLNATQRAAVRSIILDFRLSRPDAERLVGTESTFDFEGEHRILLRNLALLDR